MYARNAMIMIKDLKTLEAKYKGDNNNTIYVYHDCVNVDLF